MPLNLEILYCIILIQQCVLNISIFKYRKQDFRSKLIYKDLINIESIFRMQQFFPKYKNNLIPSLVGC